MAEVKVLIAGEELNEKEEIEKILTNLKKSEKDKLFGFLKGLTFAKTS